MTTSGTFNSIPQPAATTFAFSLYLIFILYDVSAAGLHGRGREEMRPVSWRCNRDTGQVRSGQVRLGQVRSGRVRSGQVRSGQVRAGHVRSGSHQSLSKVYYVFDL